MIVLEKSNSCAHRDYASTASVEVRVFSDCVEVWNPGELPPGKTVAWLFDEHESMPFNPLIAAAFYQARYIEHVGSGIEDVEVACAEAGLPRTTIEVRNRTLVHTVWRKTTKETIDTTKERALATKEIPPSLMDLLEGFSDVVQAIFRFFWSHREHSARNFGGLHLPAWRWPGSTSRRCEGQTRRSYSQTQTPVQGSSNPRIGENPYPSRAQCPSVQGRPHVPSTAPKNHNVRHILQYVTWRVKGGRENLIFTLASGADVL